MKPTRHHYALGLDLASLRPPDLILWPNPELKVLRAKRKEWERSKSGLSLDEFLRLNKTTI